MKCKHCHNEMSLSGFKYHNQRYTCSCGWIYVPFMERHFGENFLGVKWARMFTLILAVILISMGMVGAVECNADLSQGGNSCTVSSSLTLNGSYTIYMNGSTNGAIAISGSNTVFDCNNSVFVGNSSGDTYGIIDSGNPQNITIQHCVLQNYSRGIHLTSVYNATVINNILKSHTQSGIYLNSVSNSLIKNNTLLDNQGGTSFGAITILGSTNDTTVEDNNISSPSIYHGIRFSPSPVGKRNIIRNNYVDGVISNGLQLVGLENSSIYNNTILNTNWNGIDYAGSNSSIYSNYIFGSLHHGIDLFVGDYSTNTDGGYNQIYNNTIINSNITGILIASSWNNNVSYNNITSILDLISGDGILIGGNSSIVIGNKVNNNYISNSTNCLTDSSLDTLWENNYCRNIYANDIFKSSVTGAGVLSNPTFLQNVISSSIFRIFFDNFDNESLTFNYNNEKVILFNNSGSSKTAFSKASSLTNSLLHNGTSICNGSSANLALNTGQVNITLAPVESCYVLDNFNLTEGVDRQYSPVWIASSTKTTASDSYSIASNISATNVPTILNTGYIKCSDIKTITITPKSSAAYTTSGTCLSDSQVLVYANYDVSSSSNLITLSSYQISQGFCSNVITGYSSFFVYVPTFFAVLAVIVIIGFIGMLIFTISKPGWYSELNLNIDSEGIFNGRMLVIFFAAIALIAITAVISIAIVNALCGL